MTEAGKDFVIEHDTATNVVKFGSIALKAAQELTAVSLAKLSEEVTVDEIAQQFSQGGFNEWPAEVAHAVRNLLATEYGFDHL